MDNPFLSIDQRLENIESLLKQLAVQPKPHQVQESDYQEIKFTIKELAAYLKKDQSTIQRYKKNKVFPYYKAGRTVFFKKKEVDDAMFSNHSLNKKGAKGLE